MFKHNSEILTASFTVPHCDFLNHPRGITFWNRKHTLFKCVNACKRIAGNKTDIIEACDVALAVLDFLLGECAQFIAIHEMCSEFLIKFKSNVEFNNIKKSCFRRQISELPLNFQQGWKFQELL